MTLVYDRRADLGDAPGTHALLCGVSEYPHLPGGSGEATRFDFGLDQLDTPVRTVYALHDWLVEHADNLAAPLATARMLVAPGPAEEDAALKPADVELPTVANFLSEAADWRADASSHRDGLTIFYISGQGFIVSRADQIVLLHDYGDGIGSILHNAINVGSMLQGMAPTSWTPEIARTQLYFVDTGQSFTTLPPELAASSPTQVFDLPLEPGTDRVAITFSAPPGGVAYGKRGGLSVFGSALLECLNGLAAEQVAGEWGVTTLGLVQALPEVIRAQAAEFGVSQIVTAGGLVGPALVARLSGPPEAHLAIEVPDEVRLSAVVTVRDSTFALVLERSAPVESLLNVQLPAGLYIVELKEPGKDPKLETVSLSPSAVTRLALESAT